MIYLMMPCFSLSLSSISINSCSSSSSAIQLHLLLPAIASSNSPFPNFHSSSSSTTGRRRRRPNLSFSFSFSAAALSLSLDHLDHHHPYRFINKTLYHQLYNKPTTSSSSSWISSSPNFIKQPYHQYSPAAAAARTKMESAIGSSSSRSDQDQDTENEEDVWLFNYECSITVAANKAVDAAGEVLRKYFRNKNLHILDKDDLSPVTIADQAAEEAMVSIIMDNFPSHSIYGEEKGWIYEEKNADYVWVLDPIDGTKSFITGKPLFGTLVAVFHKGKPIVGIVDQPILRERWIGISGRKTTLNGEEVSTRACSTISDAYLYTTSPHLFSGDAETAFSRVRSKVKCPLYGCDCYAYALLASGYVDLVVEYGLKPYDILALIPVIEGAGGVITDWRGEKLLWEASSSDIKGYNVVAAGDPLVHKEALELLQWN